MAEQNPVMDPSMWSSKMATVYYGMCHTFIFADNLRADMISDGLLFFLDPELSYRIIFHDPKFYHVVSNTFTFPRIWLEYQAGKNMVPGNYEWYYISVTEHHLLNRPEQPCEEEEQYDFLQCVKTSQARRVGCRPPWDSWSPQDIQLCRTVDQLQQHESLDWLEINYEQKMIINNTRCKTQKKSNTEIYLKSVAKRSKRFFYILVRIGKPRFYTQIPRYLLTTTGKLQKTS